MIIINYIFLMKKNIYNLRFQGIHRKITLRIFITNRNINICLRKTIDPSFHFFQHKVIKREKHA
jgi:hypothetical protein